MSQPPLAWATRFRAAISRLIDALQRSRRRLAPIFAVLVVGIFLYWTWLYRLQILATYRTVGVGPLLIIGALTVTSIALGALAFMLLVRDSGYSFGYGDAYHSLNISQLASMIPGGIWGYAGLAGSLWARGVGKASSVAVIALYTGISLSACAMVSALGLMLQLDWFYGLICLVPVGAILLGRNGLDGLRARYRPGSPPLPSARTLLAVLGISTIIWVLSSGSFAWLLSRGEGLGSARPLAVMAAYAVGYLAGYISLFAPSGLGVSEGITTILLGPYIPSGRVLAVAISFRLLQTLVIWLNVLVTVIIVYRHASDQPKHLPLK